MLLAPWPGLPSTGYTLPVGDGEFPGEQKPWPIWSATALRVSLGESGVLLIRTDNCDGGPADRGLPFPAIFIPPARQPDGEE